MQTDIKSNQNKNAACIAITPLSAALAGHNQSEVVSTVDWATTMATTHGSPFHYASYILPIRPGLGLVSMDRARLAETVGLGPAYSWP